jgi:hypothetical protein
LDKAYGVDAQNGAEQPVWDSGLNRFFLSVPQIGPDVKDGGVVRIPNVRRGGTDLREQPEQSGLTEIYPVEFCGPAGLALGSRQDLVIGCNTVFDTQANLWEPNGAVPADPRDLILDAKTGQIDATIFGSKPVTRCGSMFNPGAGNYYATGSYTRAGWDAGTALAASHAPQLQILAGADHGVASGRPLIGVS